MGYFAAVLAAVLFGANGSITRTLVDSGLTAAQLTLFRVATAAIISAVVLIIGHRQAFRVSRRQLAMFAFLGVFGVAFLQWTYAVALSLIPVGMTLLIEYTAVLMVAVIAYFLFKEQVKARLWIAICCVLIGLAVVAQVWDSELDPLGVLYALAAAVCLTIYFVVGEREVGKSSPLAVAFWTMSAATLFWLIFGSWWDIDPTIFSTRVSLGGTLSEVVVPLWAPLLWNMVLGSFAPFALSLLALKYLAATAAGVVSSSEVIFAFLVAWLWLGEGLNAVQMVGATVVLGGIVLAQTARANKVVDADLALSDGRNHQLA
ncbi:MAG: EamA family transporter [Homoserinimonas sp.]|jgi:drug/metabolite transporter (DMT)-like permease|nr:EamA family transporter [Homoserinimonas sp.]